MAWVLHFSISPPTSPKGRPSSMWWKMHFSNYLFNYLFNIITDYNNLFHFQSFWTNVTSLIMFFFFLTLSLWWWLIYVKYLFEGRGSRCECLCEIWRQERCCHLMCRDESISKRTQHPLLPEPQDSPASLFWKMMLKCYPNTFAKCIIDHSFPHNQADNGVLRRPFLPFCPATQVTFLVSWTEMAFSRVGGAKSHWPYQGSPWPGERDPTFLLQPEEKPKSNSSPNLFSQLARLIE